MAPRGSCSGRRAGAGAGARGARAACGAGGRGGVGRRRAGALALAAGAALGGNLGGGTSRLLGASGAGGRELAARLGLDVLYPVRGLKRCREGAFEFLFPAEWVADQTLFRRAAGQTDGRSRLDPPPLRGRPAGPAPVAPSVGFGPPGGSGELNVSVVAERVPPGFSLAAGVQGGEAGGWGPERAEQLLGTAIAPEGSGRRAELVGTSAREDAAGVAYYGLEYTVRREGAGGFFRHNQSVFAARGGVLYTLNVQCPEAQWPALRERLGALGPSFRLR